MSLTSQRYALTSLTEAQAFLAHPVLGPRLRDAAIALMMGTAGNDPSVILGGIDAVKVRSSMTLFRIADPGEVVFQRVLERFYGGQLDPQTQQLLESER